MRLGALVLLAALAGCTLPADAPSPASVTPASVAPELPLLPPRVSGAPEAALDVEVALSERWLKPFRGFDASARAPPGALVAWFVDHDEVEPTATVVDGDVYVLKSTTPDHHNTRGPRPNLPAVTLDADGRARALRFADSGRYSFEAGGARLVVNAWPDAPKGGAQQAFLVGGAGGALRFDPPEIDLPTGARALFWSEVARPVEMREVDFAAFVPIPPEGGHVTPIDEGLYRMIALAVAPGSARGVGSLAFLVDFERPSDRVHVGPLTGRFFGPEAGADEARGLRFEAAHPLSMFVVRFNVSSLTPAPSSVVVALQGNGETLAESSSLTAHEIVLDALPAGDYRIEVRPEHGALVSFEVAGEGHYVLPTPERLRR